MSQIHRKKYPNGSKTVILQVKFELDAVEFATFWLASLDPETKRGSVEAITNAAWRAAESKILFGVKLVLHSDGCVHELYKHRFEPEVVNAVALIFAVRFDLPI